MFRRLFAARSSRSPCVPRSRRLELEPLEDRLAPASVSSSGAFSPALTSSTSNFDTFPSLSPSIGTSSSFLSLPGSQTFLTPVGGTTTAFQTPFGSPSTGTFTPLAQNGSLGSGSTPSLTPSGAATASTAGTSTSSSLAQMEQQIGALFRVAAAQNPSAAASLVMNEVFLAMDTFGLFKGQAHGAFTPSFQDLSARESAISQNPLQNTTLGQMLGLMVFAVTADQLASAQSGL